MRLEEMTVYQLRRAIRIYLEEAFRGADIPAGPAISAPDPDRIAAHLSLFLDESGGSRIYALRLGNRRYPFMKLRLLEHLVRDEFFLTVDTHDQMFLDQEDPELARLKAFNRDLKERIEAAWEGAGLPTTVNLKGLVAKQPVERAPRRNQRILLVDDEAAILDTVTLLLEGRGFDVEQACDGQDALEVVDPSRHDLVLMDVEMPRLSGFEACRELKGDPRTAKIPVLLASAGAIDLAKAASPDGYLVKPFDAEALFRFLDSHLSREGVGGPSAASSSR